MKQQLLGPSLHWGPQIPPTMSPDTKHTRHETTSSLGRFSAATAVEIASQGCPCHVQQQSLGTKNQKTFRYSWRFYSLLFRGFSVAFSWPSSVQKNSVWAFFVAFSWFFRGFFVAPVSGKIYAYSPWNNLLTFVTPPFAAAQTRKAYLTFVRDVSRRLSMFVVLGSGVVVPHLLCEISQARFWQFQGPFPLFVMGFQSFSFSLSHFLGKVVFVR